MLSFSKGGALSVAALTALTFALAGCNRSGSGGSAAPGPSAAARPLPDAQQKLTYVPNFGVQSLDITKFPLEIGVQSVVGHVLQPLVRIEKGEIKPVLAESWKWTDPTTLEFKLRSNVKFSDGTPLTAKDVKASFDRYIAAKGPLNVVIGRITSVTATDDTTVTIKTDQPLGTLVGVLSLLLVGQSAKIDDPAYWAKPIGTGPFVFKEYVANDRVVEVRNDNYWGEKAKLSELTFKIITDANAKLTALSSNDIQAVQDVTKDQLAQIEGNKQIAVTTVPSYTYYFVWFNQGSKPLDNPKVRQAMFMAIDRDTVQKEVLGSTAKTMTSFCPSTAFGCVPPTQGFPKYDPEGAKKLLAEAGYPNGFTVDVIWNTSVAVVQSYAPAFISAWKKIGITVTPRAEDATTWLANFLALKWDMDTQASQIITGDADYVLNRLYACAAKRMNYCNPELDAIMTKAQQSTDQAERLKLYQQTVDLMTKDLPAIPLWDVQANVAMRSNVRDVVIPPNEFVDFSKAYLVN